MKASKLSSFLSLFIILSLFSLNTTAQQRCGSGILRKAELERYRKNLTDGWHKSNPLRLAEGDTLVIPVVVHIVYNANVENLTLQRINSQIKVLNDDYQRRNSDASKTPAPFAAVASGMPIKFVIANRDVNGMPTSGITRTKTTKIAFDDATDDVMSPATGGIAPWDTKHYLNMYVCDIDRNILGYAHLPYGDESVDAVVIDYTAMGVSGNEPYNKGRTATHEIGHWLGLIHTWGDDEEDPNGLYCSIDDNISDTPLQEFPTESCPGQFPLGDNCTPIVSNGIMYMNYMDYTFDACMNMFSKGQVNIMNSILGDFRSQLKNSRGYKPDSAIATDIYVYQDPLSGRVSIDLSNKKDALPFKYYIFNTAGKLEDQGLLDQSESTFLTTDFATGVYILHLEGAGQSYNFRIIHLGDQ